MRPFTINKSITKYTSNLDRYLEEIRRYPLLTPDEEVTLAQQIKQWNPQALEKLINCNLRFVVSVAKFYQGNGLTLLDLINEGNIWLTVAAKKFDETRGFKFISYAVREIRKSIIQGIGETWKIVRLPAHVIRELSKIDKLTQKFYQTCERTPTEQELCEILMISQEMIKELRQKDQQHFPLSKPIFEDDLDSGTHEEQLIDKDVTDPTQDTTLQKALEQKFSMLSKRDINIIKYYWGIDEFASHSLGETAKKFGYRGGQSIAFKKKRFLKKIKEMKNIDELKSYL